MRRAFPRATDIWHVEVILLSHAYFKLNLFFRSHIIMNAAKSIACCGILIATYHLPFCELNLPFILIHKNVFPIWYLIIKASGSDEFSSKDKWRLRFVRSFTNFTILVIAFSFHINVLGVIFSTIFLFIAPRNRRLLGLCLRIMGRESKVYTRELCIRRITYIFGVHLIIYFHGTFEHQANV